MQDEIKEILESVPWLKNPEEDLIFSAYVYYQALLDIKMLIQK